MKYKSDSRNRSGSRRAHLNRMRKIDEGYEKLCKLIYEKSLPTNRIELVYNGTVINTQIIEPSDLVFNYIYNEEYEKLRHVDLATLTEYMTKRYEIIINSVSSDEIDEYENLVRYFGDIMCNKNDGTAELIEKCASDCKTLYNLQL